MNNQENNKNGNDINSIINDLPNSAMDTNEPAQPVQQPAQPVQQPAPATPVQATQPVEQAPVVNNTPQFSSNASTLGTLAPDKQKSPIAMIVLFVILIIFIIFMPQIITLVNNVLGTNLNANNGVTQNNNPTPTTDDDTTAEPEEDTTNDTIYNIDATTTIKIDDIEISNIAKNTSGTTYTLSYTLTNTSTNAYTFTKKLYLELYDDSNTFISRVLVNYNDTLSSNTPVNLSNTIDSNAHTKSSKIEAVLRTSDDYPSVSLINNSLSCRNTTNSITYTFKDDALVKILDVYTYTKTDDASKYNTDLLTNRSIISRMDNLNGVDAVLTESTTGFITSISIDYSLIKYSDLTYKTNYFAENTLSKVVSFESSSSGFTCN